MPPAAPVLPHVPSAPHATALEIAASLAEIGRDLHARGWLPATSGNLSARLGPDRALITQSGRHKGRLSPHDFLVVDLDGNPISGGRPSAETALHTRRYAADPHVGAVLHVHSPHACVISRARPRGVRLAGWELLKAFPGVDTHAEERRVAVFPNDQDIDRLGAAVDAAREGLRLPGYLIEGHGLYAWGVTLDDALRHVEAFEALFQLEWLAG